MHPLQLAASALLLALAAQAWAQDCSPDARERVVISEVVDPVTLRLSGGGVVRLAGITVPAQSEDAARRFVAARLAGVEAIVGNRSAQPDRYGRVSAQVLDADSRWLQGGLLRAGLAVVLTSRDDRTCARALLAAEEAGRRARAGIWADPDFAIAVAENPMPAERRNLYQIVEGQVVSVGKTQATVYLDFGRDWATDFTVIVSGADAALFESEGLVLSGLEGRRVRVRGWLAEANGPMIRVDHPEQIEVLDR